MKRAIQAHLGDFIAIIGLFTIAVLVAGFVLAHERLRFPLVQQQAFPLKAELSSAHGVLPGQGQTVRVAGVKIGDIGTVSLRDGRALINLDIDPKYKHLLHRDATALLRPKTGLKDMFLEVDPGSDQAPVMPKNGVIPVENTAPDVDPDEVLSVLDRDTRDYLQLLINGAGKGLAGNGGRLRGVFKRFEPFHRELSRATQAFAQRRVYLRDLVHNYQLLVNELAKRDHQLTRLVTQSNQVFKQFAAENQNVSLAVARLPGTLNTTANTLAKVNTLGQVMRPSLESLRPAVRAIDKANHQVLPFVKEAEPEIRTQIRPFVRTARPIVHKNLRPAAQNLAKATPDLTSSFHEINRFFNMGAYNPNGAEKLTGNLNQDRKRDEGYLFWLGWVGQLTNSLFNNSDAQGPIRRALTTIDCNTLRAIVAGEPGLGVILGLVDVLEDPGLCPRSAG